MIYHADLNTLPSTATVDGRHASQSESSFLSKKIRFTYTEVQAMTNNLERALGEGGFGVVYHGCVNGNQQVAVKLLSQSSSQGYKHFKAEVELLMRVHHINLVSLVGYCDEGENLALIYEYMPNGDLKQHLSGKRGRFSLSWENRLRIAVDAALGYGPLCPFYGSFITSVSHVSCSLDGNPASLLVVLVVIVLIFVFRKKKVPPTDLDAPSSVPIENVRHTNRAESSFLSKKIRFSYIEVQEMTNNFERALGEGGFGVVYHGCVNAGQQVAVKLLSQSSSQGYKHFKAEVELLMRVHHINLVSLVGYCDEGEYLALIYEYMPNGDLKQHLSGKRGEFYLSWEMRLKIAVDAALGLEYLHTGCKPPIVHRDIKTTNILLDQNSQAKLADFGLSRSFPTGNETHVSTVVAGTPGYLDPEYYKTNWLTEKSDIYSFGVVLLELITNRPIIQQSREKSHLVDWVSYMMTKGDITNIMDPRLHQNYDTGSVWKFIEIAMLCVCPSSAGRPNMSRVANDLKECLISEELRIVESRDMESKSSMDYSKDIYTEASPKAR
ncbi:hypothetical protein F2Q68_00024946 [Brassica cretica]|uniref:Protein kinase domain-containing protein n=1 Tax=Brassica cretica TaxID=69181 RepID=A0A8S9IFP4_BRACR|nr:hypothetical protein F2Q68_00024946 [Brassica cretica]